jgi:branched-chain amino acid aminotransferase
MLAYINGEFVEETDAKIPVRDRGFVLGDGIFDTWRTYGTKPSRHIVEKHLNRLRRSVNFLEMDGDAIAEEIDGATAELVERNAAEIEQAGDVMVFVAISRGLLNQPFAGDPIAGFDPGVPTRVVFFNPIPWVPNGPDIFTEGAHLVPSIQNLTPFGGYDPRVKALSRLGFVRAERKQFRVRSEARAGSTYWVVLFDDQGYIAECAGGALAIVEGDTIVHPPLNTILPSISLDVFCELGRRLGFAVEQRRLTAFDFLNADETYVLSTSIAAIPVGDLDGIPLKRGERVGPQIQQAWIDLVGFDYVAQTRELGAPSPARA